MTKYKAVIFDLGKVVFDLSFDRVLESWAIASGRQLIDIKNRFEFDEIFNQFEKNEISAEDFREIVSQRMNLKLNNIDFDKSWCDLYLDTYQGIDNLLTKMKQDYRIVALTNTNIIHHSVWRVKYADTLLHFEKVFSSHEIEARKPEEKAYKIVLDYLQCLPAEVIFLDDSFENVRGATELGIDTILVTSNTQMMNKLRIQGLIT